MKTECGYDSVYLQIVLTKYKYKTSYKNIRKWFRFATCVWTQDLTHYFYLTNNIKCIVLISRQINYKSAKACMSLHKLSFFRLCQVWIIYIVLINRTNVFEKVPFHPHDYACCRRILGIWPDTLSYSLPISFKFLLCDIIFLTHDPAQVAGRPSHIRPNRKSGRDQLEFTMTALVYKIVKRYTA